MIHDSRSNINCSSFPDSLRWQLNGGGIGRSQSGRCSSKTPLRFHSPPNTPLSLSCLSLPLLLPAVAPSSLVDDDNGHCDVKAEYRDGTLQQQHPLEFQYREASQHLRTISVSNGQSALHHCGLLQTTHFFLSRGGGEVEVAPQFLINEPVSSGAMQCLVRFLEITPAQWLPPCQRVGTPSLAVLFETAPAHLELALLLVSDCKLCKEVMQLADYLECKTLVDVASIVLASMLHNKSTEEMLAILKM